MQHDPDNTFLDTAELAERHRANPATIRYRRMTGTGPPGTLIGRKVLYRLSDVIRWEREQEAADPVRREHVSAARARRRAGAA